MEIIKTKSGQCQDCYKCVRSCPIKAIKVTSGQAEIISDECIYDGLCTVICPQGAKEIIDEWYILSNWIREHKDVMVSIAPSYLGLQQEPYQFISALYSFGVKRVEETGWAVPEVSARYWESEHLNPALTSACPAIMNLVEYHFPELISHLVPVVSPMVLHARSLKKRYPHAKVVFIGPCVAKKKERLEFIDDVDLVLTFSEVSQGLQKTFIEPSRLNLRKPDISASAIARQFPMESGWRKSWSGSDLAQKVWVVNGFQESIDFLRSLKNQKIDGQWAELMACKGGCLGGAGWNDGDNIYMRQSRLMSRVYSHQENSRPSWQQVPFTRSFTASQKTNVQIDFQEVQRVLALSGKSNQKDQLDCGACGYDTCRDKAEAVVEGKAELEMCIPYMRQKAESLSNIIIESTPNGIVVVDEKLNILSINPAAERMFNCLDSEMIGKTLDFLIPSEDFQTVLNNRELLVNTVSYHQYSIITRQYIFPVKKQNVLIGIFSDITQEQKQTEELANLKEETLQRASEVIEKQMRVAQEIAGLLGETTGETKILLSKLIDLIDKEEGGVM